MSCLRVADVGAGLPNPSLLDVAVPQVRSFQGRVRGSSLGFSYRAGEDGQTQRGEKGVCVAWLLEESWRRCPEDRWMRRERVRQVSAFLFVSAAFLGRGGVELDSPSQRGRASRRRADGRRLAGIKLVFCVPAAA